MEYRKDVTLHSSWDIIVCGAGPSGIAAAISAARMGMKVMLLERFGSVGGCLTLSNVTTIMGGVEPGTIRDELAALLESPDTSTGIDIEDAKCRLTLLLDKEGVTFRLQTPVVDTLVENGVIRGVYVLTQSGLMLMEAQRVIDATGDGYVAAMAGCEVMLGRDEDGLVQPSSLMYTISGVNEDCTLIARNSREHTILPDGQEYLATCKEAAADGRLPENVTIVRLYNTLRKGERLVNATQMNRVCILNDGDAERSEIELRKQIEQVNHFLRTEIPGFANIYTRVSASTLGVRESRRIKGQYIMRVDDLLNGRRFEDVVVHNADFVIDIHNPSGGGQSTMKRCSDFAKPYDIPMRALQPLHVENLVLSGRSISGSHRAHSSYRVMNIAMAIGQASGVMAAVSIQDNTPVSQLEYAHVKAALEAQGCVLVD